MKFPRAVRFLPPIVIGTGLAIWLISTAEPPARVDEAERSVVARTITAAETPVRPVVRGYGNVQAARHWEAVSEIAGTIIWRHPDLDTGNVIAADTTVLRIDPTAYELELAQAEADLAAIEADRAQIDIDAANTSQLLTLEQTRLNLAETDLARIRELRERGVTSQSALDQQERTTLQVRRSVAELQNTLNLLPSRRHRLDAQMARTTALLDSARRDLQKTEIVTPFDLRVDTVHVERHQFVATGQKLVTADDIARAEIIAQIPVESFRRLVGSTSDGATLTPGTHFEGFDKVSVEVRLVSDPSQSWPGELLRVERALDPQARSVPAVVSVDDPYSGAKPPLRLPLVSNMYVELILTGPVTESAITLPDSAIHQGGLVYLRDDEGRLELRKVAVAWRQDGQAVLADGIAPGEEVILDDLMQAIPGMKVVPAESGQ